MRKKRSTEEQIIAVLKEHELGSTAAELGRKHGISPQTQYNWKNKYGVYKNGNRLTAAASVVRFRRRVEAAVLVRLSPFVWRLVLKVRR